MKSFISYMKIRASYGIVGNDRTPDKSRFLYLPDSYNPSSGSYLFGTGLGTSHPGAEESKKGNPDVTWEKSAKQNYGFNINFFNAVPRVLGVGDVASCLEGLRAGRFAAVATHPFGRTLVPLRPGRQLPLHASSGTPGQGPGRFLGDTLVCDKFSSGPKGPVSFEVPAGKHRF